MTDFADCLVGLGGNVGDVPAAFERAIIRFCEEGCHVTGVSRIYRSAAMGPDAGDPFFNAVVRLETRHTPSQLLDVLQRIETEAGRKREVHWGPRTLDLDLLCWGQDVLCSSTLTVPHSGMWYRRFVLQPALEVASDFQHPACGMTICQLNDRLDQRPLVIEFATRGDIRGIPREFAGEVDVQRVSSQDARAASAFCRVENVVVESGEVTDPFTIAVDEVEMPQMLSAVLSAALGQCAVCSEV